MPSVDAHAAPRQVSPLAATFQRHVGRGARPKRRAVRCVRVRHIVHGCATCCMNDAGVSSLHAHDPPRHQGREHPANGARPYQARRLRRIRTGGLCHAACHVPCWASISLTLCILCAPRHRHLASAVRPECVSSRPRLPSAQPLPPSFLHGCAVPLAAHGHDGQAEHLRWHAVLDGARGEGRAPRGMTTAHLQPCSCPCCIIARACASWAHPCRICTGTGLVPATSAPGCCVGLCDDVPPASAA